MASSSLRHELEQYFACDISDALLALEETSTHGRRHGGFLSDLVHLNPFSSSTQRKTLVYPVSTVQFQPIAASDPSSTAVHASEPRAETSNIPPGVQWSDVVKAADCFVVIQQPPGQKCAVVGGIHMARLSVRGAKGLIVEGRVRDLSQLQTMNLPVWAKGVSTVGAGAECKAYAVEVPVSVSGLCIDTGDWICLDEHEGGAVRIPGRLVDPVLAWLKERGDSEEKILEMVNDGGSVTEAFKKFR